MSLVIQRSEAAELVKSPLWELNVFAVPPPPVYAYTALGANHVAYGVRDFNNTIQGNRYKTISSVNNTVLIGGGFGTFANITGSLVIDIYDGSIVSHVMTQPPPGTVLNVGDGACLPWSDPSRVTTGDLNAVWTDGVTTFQSIALSNPTSLGNLTDIVTALLDAVLTDANKDTSTLAENSVWLTGYNISDNPFARAGYEYWLPTWVWDPLGGGVIGAWVNVGVPSMKILDRDIPAHGTPTTFLTELYVWSPGVPGDVTSGPQSNVEFFQGGAPMVWGAGRLLVRHLPPNSFHCIAQVYDTNAHTAGNADNSFSIQADALGILLVNEPSLLVNSGLDGEQGTNFFYPNRHPSGITCVP